MNYKTYRFQIISAFVVGLVFGLGLVISGMTQAQKVIGFLDVVGDWDPSLMFVMLSAIPVHFLSYKWIANRSSPLLDMKWHYPTKKEITKPLIWGSILFGMGWGLGGFCPGPALVAIGSGALPLVLFVISMFLGMWLFAKVNEKVHFHR